MTNDELVDEIFGRCRERIERGERVDVDEVLRAHPDLADALRERFAAVRLLDRARRRRASADTTRVGTTLGGYRIRSVLGAGGMGTVYQAQAERDGGADERVAMKVFHPHLVVRERFVARFRREAELGRRVRHPNVVRTLDAGEALEADRPVRFLVMEYVEGRTLRELLAESGRLPEELVRHVGREVAKGLAAIHTAGAIHRDLKPENVIIARCAAPRGDGVAERPGAPRRDGEGHVTTVESHVVKVMDLGVARVDDAATLSESGAFVGSLRYGAPEQISQSGRIDGRADLHALGVLLFELATGERPFDGEDFGEVVRQILDLRPRRCGELVPQLSPFLEELIAQLLEKDRERRPASAEAVASILADGESSAWWKERAAAMRRETRRPLRRIRIPRETALYGRGSETARLRELFERTKAGDGQVVLVEGEAGIGKSRLVDEFVTSLVAAGEDVDFLFGSYPPGGAATASGAFATAYREHLGDDEDAIREALSQTPLLVPAFAALLRGDVAPADAEKLTKDSIQTVFVHATRSFAARRTTIVLIDDLHFAPEEGRALFTSLALAVPGHRILLIGGARRSLDAKWSAGVSQIPNASRLAVERLSPKDLVELLADALKSRHLAEDLGGKVAAKADGNPYFAFEILRGLREGQFLTRTPTGTWITTRSIREIEVPPSIVEVIQARVSDLGKDERDVLEAACCVGFEFEAALLGAVLGVAPIPLLQRLGRIERMHRLVRSLGHRFAFDHHQVQEVLYAGLSAPQREAYHASIAEAIEARSGAVSKGPKDLDGALCVDLAEHYLAGSKGERALRYLDPALTHLESRWLNDAAVRLCDRALAVPGLVTGGDRARLLLRLATTLDLLARREPQRAALEEAAALALEAGDGPVRAMAIGSLGLLCSSLGRFAEAREHYERQLALARAVADRRAEVSALGHVASVLRVLGRPAEAREHQERCLALAREIGERRWEVTATGNLGNVFWSVGDYAAAQVHYARQLELALAYGDRRGEAAALNQLGSVHRVMGRRSEARAHHDRSLSLAREIGDRRAEAHATGNLANCLYASGRLAEAWVLYERDIALEREIADRHAQAKSTANFGSLLGTLGRLDEAREHLERGLAIARELGDRLQECVALAGLARVAAEAEDTSPAAELAAQSNAVSRSIGARNREAESLWIRGWIVAIDCTRSGDACADLEAARSMAQELGLVGVAASASAHLARLRRANATEATAALEAAGDLVDLPTRMQTCHELWRAARGRTHLAEATRLLDFMVEHAPPECRESMLSNVRLHREIVAAWREHGAADGGPAAA